MRLLSAAVVWMACAHAIQATPLPEWQAIAITAVTVIDVEHGRSVGPRTVLIDNGRIVSIVAPREAHIPANTRRVDGHGRFLIPGLVDMHVLRAASLA